MAVTRETTKTNSKIIDRRKREEKKELEIRSKRLVKEWEKSLKVVILKKSIIKKNKKNPDWRVVFLGGGIKRQ